MICANEPSPSGSRRPRHRDPLPLCRCPQGRRVPGSRRLPGGRGHQVGVVRLGHRHRPRTRAGPAGRGQVGQRAPPPPRPQPWHRRRPTGDRRAWPARLAGAPPAGGAPDAHPWHRRLPTPPASQPHQARCRRGARAGPAGSAVRPRPAGCGLVWRYHLHPHRRGLAVFGFGHRPGLAAPAGLCDGRPPRRRPGHRGPGRRGGYPRLHTHARYHLPQRPRRRGRIQLVVATPRR